MFQENKIKYPRTLHVMWSPGSTSDDKFHYDLSDWYNQEIVVTEKMDGENTTMYNNLVHARSPDSKHHESRNQIKSLHATIKNGIPDHWRICGENLTAVHSIKYQNLKSIFLGFNVWDDQNICKSWSDTLWIFSQLNIEPVPVLWKGIYTKEVENQLKSNKLFELDTQTQEGYVIRLTKEFNFGNFRNCVGKYVRKNHITTDQHWMKKPVEYNLLES